MIPIEHRTDNKCLISILNKEDKVVDYYQKLQQSPSMHQFKKILHVLYLDEPPRGIKAYTQVHV